MNRRRTWPVVLLCVLALAAACAPTPPSQPSTGLGSTGPCGHTQVDIPDSSNASFMVTIATPTGTASAPLTGGTCDDGHRPVAFLVHGLGGQWPWLYQSLINHLVSTGHVVVFVPWSTWDLPNISLELLGLQTSIDTVVPKLVGVDMTRVGIFGHSLGGSALPTVTRMFAARGWGSNDFWLAAFAPAYLYGVGNGDIEVPSNTEALVVNFDQDTFVDTRMGIDLYHSMTIPEAQKRHVTLLSGGEAATHTVPNDVVSPATLIRSFGVFRNIDAVAACSLTGTHCTEDLTFMGTYADGTEVRRAVQSTNPVDVGPPALECDGPGNPRSNRCSF